MKPLVIIGSGDYAQEVLWVVDEINAEHPTWEFLGFVDPAKPQRKGQNHYDRPILGGYEDAADLPQGVYFACGIGSPPPRVRECPRAEELGWQPATLIHPTVVVARHVEVGAGTIVGACAVLAPYSRIGRHCSINLDVTIGHNSVLGDYCVISPGARINGHVVLGDSVYVGSNATVYQRRRVGAGASVGANSFLLTNLAAGRSAIGVPAAPFCAAKPERSAAAAEAQPAEAAS